MNGRRDAGVAVAAEIARRAKSGSLSCDLLLCPPATLLIPIGAALVGSPVALGGQDCHPRPDGPHTGDLSAAMLADAGCRFVIVGHSERRAGHGETDALVRAKAEAARAAGLVTIVCLGETESERDAGQALAVVERQLARSLPPGATAADTVIAYEPIWAIGTGRSAAPADVAEMHGHLRRLLRARAADAARVRLLYGGSVKPDNAAALLAVAEVDGALVGGASLKADDFWAIAQGCP